MKTYFHHPERGFANEYSVGVALTPSDHDHFLADGWERVPRRVAMKLARYRGDAVTEAYVGYRFGNPRNESSVADRASWLAKVEGGAAL